MNYGTYTWKLTNSQSIFKLLNAKVGESFESEVFDIGKLQWVIVVYPNGWNDKNEGHLNVCIKLLSIHSKWRELILCRTIECLETMSSCTSIASYYKSGDTMCWKEGTCLLSELFQMKSPIKIITFRISINILQIIYKKSSQIFYPNISNNNNTVDYKQQQYIQWKIDNEMLSKFRLSYHSKSFESKKYHNRMWCIRCYPNGISSNDKGYIGLYLTLCGLPPSISKIKVLYTFKCKEYKNLKHSRIKNFSYNDKSSWGVSRFFEFVQLHKIRSLTFYIDITIMNEYDENGKEIIPSLSGLTNITSRNISRSQFTDNMNRFDKFDKLFGDIDLNSTKTFSITKSKVDTDTNTEEEKVSINCISSQTLSQYHTHKNTNNNQTNLYEIMQIIKKEINSEVKLLQESYNIRLNSLCSIVEQIQINNDMLSNQTGGIMKTVNDVCQLMQKERKNLIKLKNNKNSDIEIIKSELANIKEFILQQQRTVPFFQQNNTSTKTRMTHDTNITLPLFEQEIKDEYTNNMENNEVVLWLKNDVKMPQYIDNFILNGFDDLNVIKELSINELDIIGIKKLGHKMKLLQHIRKLYKKDMSNNINKSNIHIERIKNNNHNDINSKDIFINMSEDLNNNNSYSHRSRSWQQEILNKGHKTENYSAGLLGIHNRNNNIKRNLSVNGIKRRSKTIVNHNMMHKVYSDGAFNQSSNSSSNKSSV